VAIARALITRGIVLADEPRQPGHKNSEAVWICSSAIRDWAKHAHDHQTRGCFDAAHSYMATERLCGWKWVSQSGGGGSLFQLKDELKERRSANWEGPFGF